VVESENYVTGRHRTEQDHKARFNDCEPRGWEHP